MRKEEDVVIVERIRDVEVEEDIYRTGEREMGEKFGGGYKNSLRETEEEGGID